MNDENLQDVALPGTGYTIPDTQPHIEIEVTPDRNFKVPCPDCGKLIASGYLRTHRRDIHGILVPRGKRGRKPKDQFVTAPPPRKPKPQPLSADEVVAVIMAQLFPSGVPGARVEEVFLAVIHWRDQTEEFLNHVQ